MACRWQLALQAFLLSGGWPLPSLSSSCFMEPRVLYVHRAAPCSFDVLLLCLASWMQPESGWPFVFPQFGGVSTVILLKTLSWCCSESGLLGMFWLPGSVSLWMHSLSCSSDFGILRPISSFSVKIFAEFFIWLSFSFLNFEFEAHAMAQLVLALQTW